VIERFGGEGRPDHGHDLFADVVTALGDVADASSRSRKIAAMTPAGAVLLEGATGIKIFLADDHSVIRDGLRVILEALDDGEVKGSSLL
jgi:hypothetical protein